MIDRLGISFPRNSLSNYRCPDNSEMTKASNWKPNINIICRDSSWWYKTRAWNFLSNEIGNANSSVVFPWIITPSTLSMLTYYVLEYPLECAPALPAGAHCSGYLNNQ